ncbi:transposase [Cylindrospermum stagnale]|uniref:transposase n=1 Tax=Cylindrospermum stagnale TaxID=142864 RepID=UPI0002FEFEE9|nr:transposase [Cylindrospermum stagnale]
MLVLEAELKGRLSQYNALNEAIWTASFICDQALRYWQDQQGVSNNVLQQLCAILAQEFTWAGKLNSMAPGADADRAGFAIKGFHSNCLAKKLLNIGYPQSEKMGSFRRTQKLWVEAFR